MTIASATVLNLAIEGMSCGHCVARVTKALTGIPGVEVTSVIIGSAQIAVAETSAAKAAVAALGEAGYPVRVESPATAPVKRTGGCCGGASENAKGITGGTACCS